jgi:hypothetical protein
MAFSLHSSLRLYTIYIAYSVPCFWSIAVSFEWNCCQNAMNMSKLCYSYNTKLYNLDITLSYIRVRPTHPYVRGSVVRQSASIKYYLNLWLSVGME